MTPFFGQKLHKVDAHATSWLVFLPLLQLFDFCRGRQFATHRNFMGHINQRLLRHGCVAIEMPILQKLKFT